MKGMAGGMRMKPDMMAEMKGSMKKMEGGGSPKGMRSQQGGSDCPMCMLGRVVEHHSPAQLTSRPVPQGRLEAAMREVHTDIPSTVPAHMKGAKKEAMLRAIAYSKARKAA